MSENDVKQQGNKRGPHRWKKGESGNPNGRPKKEYAIPDMLRSILAEDDKMIAEKRSNLESICRTAVNQAKGGDKDARNWISDRTEGKAIDRIIQKIDDDELIIL